MGLVPSSLPIKELFHVAHTVIKVEKGTFLFLEESMADKFFIILAGKVQLGKVLPDGRELTFKICTVNEMIGENIIFSNSPYYLMNAKVMEDGEVAVFSKNDLEEMLSINSHLAFEFMKWMANQNRKNQTKLRDLVLHGKKGALYSTLIRLSNRYGLKTEQSITLNIQLTHQELGNICGTSREVINRLLSDLKKLGVVSFNKGIITIHNLPYLKKKIDCENCPVDICTLD